jgi:hypothetical protein
MAHTTNPLHRHYRAPLPARRFPIAALVLLTTLALAGPAPARAAPADVEPHAEADYGLEILMPIPPICVGQEAKVLVYAVTKMPGWRGRDTRIWGPWIEALSENTGIISIAPESAGTGWDIFEDEPNAATFTLTPKEPGKTHLVFESMIRGIYYGPRVEVEVVTCKYKTTMTYHNNVPQYGYGTYVINGRLSTEIIGDGETFSGSGTLVANTAISVPGCAVGVTTYESATNITAEASGEDQLSLHFQYSPGSATVSYSCPNVSGSASGTTDPSPSLIASASLPAAGGTRTFDAPGGGTMTVTIAPEEAGG